MKHIPQRILLVIMLCMLLPFSVIAQTQEEFELECRKKTAAPCTVYNNSNTDHVMLDTLPAGTYVKVHGSHGDLDNWVGITYMKNGTIKSGWAEVTLINTTSEVRWSDGYLHSVHENDPDYDAKMKLGTVEIDIRTGYALYPEPGMPTYDNQSSTAASGETTQSAPAAKETTKKQTGSSSKKSGSTAKNNTAPAATAGSSVTVQIVRIGTLESTIKMNGEKRQIATADITFGKDVPAEKAVAVVHAPKTGKASLRATASDKGSVIKTCKAGTVVGVIELGKKYTRVNANGVTGYMLTSSLKFSAANVETLGTATLTYNGKATGKTTVNIRCTASKDSAKVAEWTTGTEVTVFGEKNGWYEIEADGIHGWVMDDFLTMQN